MSTESTVSGAEHLYYETMGDRSKPCLLLIHGFLTSNGQWICNREFLLNHFNLVMVELWGHGNSPAPEDEEAYTNQRYMQELSSIRESLGIEQWFIIGQSYGACIALNYALEHSEQTLGVTITNSQTALGEMPGEMKRENIENNFANLRELPMHPINARNMSPELKQHFVEIADSTNIKASIKGALTVPSHSCRNKVQHLKVPTLLTNGTRETRFQPSVAYVREVQPNIKIVDLDAGHSVNVDAPEAFNREVLGFFSPLMPDT